MRVVQSLLFWPRTCLFVFTCAAGIMDGTDKPDYDACVAIVTREALKEMVWPALLALLLPVCVGFGFKYFGAWTGRSQLGVEVVAGFMMFGTLAGLLMAMFMDNAGGAWDNAKKLIESQGAKGSEAHKAAVTGDTVGVSETQHKQAWIVVAAGRNRLLRADCSTFAVFVCFRRIRSRTRPDRRCTSSSRRSAESHTTARSTAKAPAHKCS